jgi:VWFA-related protein
VQTALIVVSALTLHTGSIRAQDALADDVVRVKTDLQVFPIRVRNQTRAEAVPLTEHDLTIKDQDHVTSGLYLYKGTDRVSLVFALDQSGSLRNIISAQRDAAIALFRRFGDRSQVSVIHFSDRPSVVAPFGRDSEVASAAFDFPVKTNTHTAIFNAAAVAIETFSVLPRVRSERRIVILISDGLDTASNIKAAAVIENARRAGVSFYVIHLPLFEPKNGRLQVRSPAKGFRELAKKTGGQYFLAYGSEYALAPPANVDLTSVFKAIEEDLSNQYLLGFYANQEARDRRNHRFILGLPEGFEYQIAGGDYARTHQFLVNATRAEQIVPK